EEELEGDWVAERDFSLEEILFDHDEQANAPHGENDYASANGDLREFDHFLESNVQPQRQEGFSTVEVKIRRGDLTPDQLRGIGLNQAVQDRLVQMQIDDELTRRIHVKMSGCPNGCGQHHIAGIGFYGASIKVGEHSVPAYIPHIGGAYEGGEVRYGHRLKAR